jgi:glycosyltransferase involved in cell wall biosynthesis
MRISVIIPTLNEEKLIESMLRQFKNEIKNHYDIELILSDGGSSDNTVEIASRYVDKILIQDDKLTKNISIGRNRGFLRANGDVLVFLNADTRFSDINAFFNLVRSFYNNNSFVAIAFPVRVFPEEEKLSDKLFHKFYNFYVRILNKFFIGMGRGECHVIKRKVFEKVGGYNETLFAGEDFDLYKRIRKFGRILFAKDNIIYESPRRYRKYGYIKVFFDWAKNAISVVLFRKSISKTWEAVR